MRAIGVPRAAGRALQRVVHALAAPWLDPVFLPSMHGFRCDRAVHTAVEYLAQARVPGIELRLVRAGRDGWQLCCGDLPAGSGLDLLAQLGWGSTALDLSRRRASRGPTSDPVASIV